VAALLLLATFAHAATLTGNVTNGTSNKPAAGDEVVLLKLAQGMEEAGRTKTDAAGHFSFTLDDAQAPHLLRVIHQGVTYHKQAPPGSTTADVQVFDAAKKLDGVNATVQVMRIQAVAGQLQVAELYGVNNASSPPRTLMADEGFQVELPAGAEIESSIAMSGGGMPLNLAPVPNGKQKGRYFFIFPQRPGETRFQINYHLPYTGEATLKATGLYALEHFVVIVPKAMQFAPADAGRFSPMEADPGANTQVSSAVKLGETVAFKLSGTGEFPREADAAEGAAATEPAGAAPDTRPGGGLGPPSDAPDPLRQYRWYILGVLALAMTAGAIYVLRRGAQVQPAPAAAASAATARTPVRGNVARPSSAGYGSGDVAATPSTQHAAILGGNGRARHMQLLEALKEELFQLEVERQQGQMTEADYQQAKAALDLTIGRALKRGTPA